jgi:hypothetical protein
MKCRISVQQNSRIPSRCDAGIHTYSNTCGSFAADVKVDVKGDGKVVTRNGEEYLEVNNVKTKIRVGDSSVKVNAKDDRNGRLSEYKCRLQAKVSLTDKQQDKPPTVTGFARSFSPRLL